MAIIKTTGTIVALNSSSGLVNIGEERNVFFEGETTANFPKLKLSDTVIVGYSHVEHGVHRGRLMATFVAPKKPTGGDKKKTVGAAHKEPVAVASVYGFITYVHESGGWMECDEPVNGSRFHSFGNEVIIETRNYHMIGMPQHVYSMMIAGLILDKCG